MKTVVYGEDQRLIEWAETRIGTEFRSDAVAIGIVDEGDVDAASSQRDSKGRLIAAAVVFDGFSATDCNMHVASDGSKAWLTRELLASAFAYPFIQCRLQRVTGLVPVSNRAALQFDLNLGFRLEGVCREAMPGGEDLYVLGMLRRECRFIPKEYRQ